MYFSFLNKLGEGFNPVNYNFNNLLIFLVPFENLQINQICISRRNILYYTYNLVSVQSKCHDDIKNLTILLSLIEILTTKQYSTLFSSQLFCLTLPLMLWIYLEKYTKLCSHITIQFIVTRICPICPFYEITVERPTRYGIHDVLGIWWISWH